MNGISLLKSLFNKRYWDNWISACKRIKLDCYFTPYKKMTSKCKTWNYKTLRRKYRCISSWLDLDICLRCETKRQKYCRLPGLHHNQKLLCFKGYYQKSDKVIYWVGEVFKNPMSNKGFVSRIYKELLQFNNKKQSKWAK